uniref:Senescence-associated protein n=1 Tax=Salix viminalis TaxID=40686 RepID=A0A6N2N562_SALVM
MTPIVGRRTKYDGFYGLIGCGKLPVIMATCGTTAARLPRGGRGLAQRTVPWAAMARAALAPASRRAPRPVPRGGAGGPARQAARPSLQRAPQASFVSTDMTWLVHAVTAALARRPELVHGQRVERCARGLMPRDPQSCRCGHPEQQAVPALPPRSGHPFPREAMFVTAPEPTDVEEKKHLQLIHERSTALNGPITIKALSWHNSFALPPLKVHHPSPVHENHDFLEPIHGAEFCHCRIQLALPSLPSREIAAMIKTRSNPLSKPRAHAMTCMNQKRAAEFTGIAFAAETADTAESAAIALFDPVTAGLYSRRATARAPPSPRVPGPGTRVPASVKRAPGGLGDESERHGAESQWIVAARPLCHLQYPVAYLSRLQRILPAARWELYFKAARAALPPRGLGQRHVPPGPRGPTAEAFSHNPTHGSFAPLAFQPSAMTNCANQRFLSRADIEGSKSNVAMNAWLPQASYPCGNFSDTSSFKFRRSKGSIGHAFTVRIRTGNQNQTSFYPFVPHEISVLVELILGHLRYLLTDVPPQPNSPPDNVFRPDRPPKRPWVQKEGSAPPPIHGITPTYPTPLKSFHKVGLESSSRSLPADSAKPVPLAVVSLDSRQGQWESR